MLLGISYGNWLSDKQHAHIHTTCNEFQSLLYDLQQHEKKPTQAILPSPKYDDTVVVLETFKFLSAAVAAAEFDSICKKVKTCFRNLEQQGYSLLLSVKLEAPQWHWHVVISLKTDRQSTCGEVQELWECP